MRPFTYLRLAVFLLLPFLFSCRQPPPSNPAAGTAKPEQRTIGTRGGKLVYRVSSPPKTFNYLLANDEHSILTAFFLLNSRLVEFDHSKQAYVPGLAETWTTGSDGRSVDIRLRDGLKFSDGQPLTSSDVAFTLEAIYDERTKAEVFRDALLINGKPISVKVIDERNLQFVFPETIAARDNYLYNIAVLPRNALEADQKAGRLSEAWKITAPPASVVSSGPFIVESAAAAERIVLKRNPYYWKRDAQGTQLPYLDELTLQVVPDANQARVGLDQATIDIVDRIRPTDYASLLNAGGAVRAFDLGPSLGVDYIWFNLNPANPEGSRRNPATLAWFSDARFRRAVSMAVDRDSIARSTLQGLATPLYGVVSPANRMWANPDLPKIAYDLGQAASLLQEAGFTKRGAADAPELLDAQGNRVEFALLVPAENEPRKLMAAVIQEDLAKLGIKMHVVPIEFAAITNAWTKSHEYDAILLGLSVTDLEPSTYANLLLSSGEAHQWRPNQKSPSTEWETKVDELFAEQARESDPEKRKSKFHEIQRIVADASPVITIVSRHVVSAANSRVGNFSPSPMFPYSMWNAEELFIKQ
ncbi:MAG TPA: ABC transporter substrate-binding protein [Pyrinomonadaceae bacterium]|nr:ABC transporter substrate-binding protein [Pyrinomonadaceae bacterium]